MDIYVSLARYFNTGQGTVENYMKVASELFLFKINTLQDHSCISNLLHLRRTLDAGLPMVKSLLERRVGVYTWVRQEEEELGFSFK